MAEVGVRTLHHEELPQAARIVAQGMLAPISDELMSQWAERFEPERTHGAFAPDGSMAGTCRWFRTDQALPGGSAPAAAVSAVAVLPNHRRRGHLRRLMLAQLDQLADEGVPLATLIAAEWPIYGRYGYGPATQACTWELDAGSARFLQPAEGAIELVSHAELRQLAPVVFRARWARTPGAILRDDHWWDRAAGLKAWPGHDHDPTMLRSAVWHDASGDVAGAVAYTVAEEFTRNRPTSRAEVKLLVGRTPLAERELWRHLCEIDWVSTVVGGGRGVDEALPYWLHDGRAAVQVDRSDHTWTRVLDVPAALGARRSTVPGRSVVEVVDELGYAAGRWSIELAPDGADITRTDAASEVTLPIGALGAALLGGTSVALLHEGAWLDEEKPGAVARLDALLSWPTSPWCPTSF